MCDDTYPTQQPDDVLYVVDHIYICIYILLRGQGVGGRGNKSTKNKNTTVTQYNIFLQFSKRCEGGGGEETNKSKKIHEKLKLQASGEEKKHVSRIYNVKSTVPYII